MISLRKSMVALFATASLAVSCSKSDINARRSLSEEEVFSGVVLQRGPVATILQQQGGMPAAAQMPMDENKMAKLQEELLAAIRKDNPGYLSSFKADMTSGNPYRVQNALKAVPNAVKKAMANMAAEKGICSKEDAMHLDAAMELHQKMLRSLTMKRKTGQITEAQFKKNLEWLKEPKNLMAVVKKGTTGNASRGDIPPYDYSYNYSYNYNYQIDLNWNRDLDVNLDYDLNTNWDLNTNTNVNVELNTNMNTNMNTNTNVNLDVNTNTNANLDYDLNVNTNAQIYPNVNINWQIYPNINYDLYINWNWYSYIDIYNYSFRYLDLYLYVYQYSYIYNYAYSFSYLYSYIIPFQPAGKDGTLNNDKYIRTIAEKLRQ
jgi:hypothetical protein